MLQATAFPYATVMITAIINQTNFFKIQSPRIQSPEIFEKLNRILRGNPETESYFRNYPRYWTETYLKKFTEV